MVCTMTTYNGNPIIVEAPNQVELEVVDCAPGAKGDTATNVTKPAKVETGAEFIVPGFIKIGNIIKSRHANRRVRRTCQQLAAEQAV